MTGFVGRKFLLKIGDGASPEVFTTVAALRDTTNSENDEAVDTTSKDDNGYRRLLADRIKQSKTVTATGVFRDEASIASVRTAFRAGTHSNYQLDIASSDAVTAGETLEGAFRVTNFEVAGTYDGEINYSLTLESDGEITSS